ncbi:MAG: PTS sugar transporter subunit IIA [Thomasclavelia ramosa]
MKFGHSVNDPVRVLLALAAKSDEEHLKLFQEVALCLMDRKYLHKIFNARSYQDILKDNKNIDAIKGGLIVSCYADSAINPIWTILLQFNAWLKVVLLEELRR